MKKILFVDDIFKDGIPRYQELVKKTAVFFNSGNVIVQFTTQLPDAKESEDDNGSIFYIIPDFDNYDLIFIHNSYANPIINEGDLEVLRLMYDKRLYTFSGTKSSMGLSRDVVYENFPSFINLIERFDQIEIDILRVGLKEHLSQKLVELLNEITDKEVWKTFLSDNWWNQLQYYLKPTPTEIQDIKDFVQNLSNFRLFKVRLEEIKNMAVDKLFIR